MVADDDDLADDNDDDDDEVCTRPGRNRFAPDHLHRKSPTPPGNARGSLPGDMVEWPGGARFPVAEGHLFDMGVVRWRLYSACGHADGIPLAVNFDWVAAKRDDDPVFRVGRMTFDCSVCGLQWSLTVRQVLELLTMEEK